VEIKMHLNRSFCPRQKNPGFVIFRPPAISETGRTLKKAGDGLLYKCMEDFICLLLDLTHICPTETNDEKI